MSQLRSYILPGSQSFLGPDIFSRPREASPYPAVDPEEANSLLADAGERSLGGLAYLGKLADKTFGARAIRGVLGGRPREALSIIPMSDTMGLTNEADVVHGRKLLEGAGVLSPGGDPTTFGMNDAIGIAAEIAMDPATYLGFGTLTKAGKVVHKLGGAMPRGTANRIAGYAVREADLVPWGKPRDVAYRLGINPDSVLTDATDQALRRAGVFVETQKLSRPTSLVPHLVDNPKRATPLAGALGIGLPFGEHSAILTGRLGQLLARNNPITVATLPARMADRAVDKLTGFSPMRAARAMFDPNVKAMYTASGQELASTFLRPREIELQAAAMKEYGRVLQDLNPIVGDDVAKTAAAMQYARATAERARISSQLMATLNTMFTPQELLTIRRSALELRKSIGARRKEALKLGIRSDELTDPAILYFTRSQEVVPRQPGEPLFDYFMRMNRQYSASHQSQIAREEIFKGIPGGTAMIDDWARSPALSGPTRTMSPIQVESRIVRDLSRGGPVTRSMRVQATHLADWLGRLPRVHSEKGMGFFRQDLPADFLRYAARDASARSAAETTYEAIGKYAKPITPATAGNLIPLDRVARLMDLRGRDALGTPIAPQLIAKRLGVMPNAIKKYGLPSDLFHDMRRLNQAWQNPTDVVPILAAWDAVTQMFKTHVTSVFPAFHSRNLMTAVFNMWRGGEGPLGAIDPKAMKQAIGIVRGGQMTEPLPGFVGNNPAEWTKELFTELIGNGVAFVPRQTNAADILGAAGEALLRRPNLPVSSGKGVIGDAVDWAKGWVPRTLDEANPFSVSGVLKSQDVFTPVRQMRQLGQAIEEWSRSSHYIALRRQGWAPEAAAMQVKKYQIDYSDLTLFEKNVMRRIAPWYAFSRRNLPPILEDAVTAPAKLTSTLRAITGGREPFGYIPPHVAEGASLPIAGAPEGEQRYVSSFGLPVEDELVRVLSMLAKGDLSRAGQSAFGMTMPQIRGPVEQIFNKQLYTGRPLSELKPSETASLFGLIPEDAARRLTQIIVNTPASRFLSTADRIADSRKDPATKAINLMSGVRISDVNVEEQELHGRRALLAGFLAGKPGVRRGDQLYISKKELESGRVSPETLRLYRIYMDLDRQIAKQAKMNR